MLSDEDTIAVLEAQLARAILSRDHTHQWYAERLERLKDLLKTNGLWKEGACIIANGTLTHEPPTYAQQLNVMRHRAEAAEAALVKFQRLYSTEWGGEGKTDATFAEAFEKVYLQVKRET